MNGAVASDAFCLLDPAKDPNTTGADKITAPVVVAFLRKLLLEYSINTFLLIIGCDKFKSEEHKEYLLQVLLLQYQQDQIQILSGLV